MARGEMMAGEGKCVDISDVLFTGRSVEYGYDRTLDRGKLSREANEGCLAHVGLGVYAPTFREEICQKRG